MDVAGVAAGIINVKCWTFCDQSLFYILHLQNISQIVQIIM